MFLSLVNAVPIGALVVIVVALVVGLTLLGVRLARRIVPATRDGFDAEVSSQLLGVVATLFGLLLAFVVVRPSRPTGTRGPMRGKKLPASPRSSATAGRSHPLTRQP
jgi:hypothetical protein